MSEKGFITKPAYIENPPKPPVTKKNQQDPSSEETLDGMIVKHHEVIEAIEQLEKEKDSLQMKIAKEIKDFSKEELLWIYPSLKDNDLKYIVFNKIQNF